MAKCLAYKSDSVAVLGRAGLGLVRQGWAWLARQGVVGLEEAGFLSSPSTRCQTIISTRSDLSIMSQGHLKVPLLFMPVDRPYC
jgi:hypothetical protein